MKQLILERHRSLQGEDMRHWPSVSKTIATCAIAGYISGPVDTGAGEDDSRAFHYIPQNMISGAYVSNARLGKIIATERRSTL
jgi:hypothetical protein